MCTLCLHELVCAVQELRVARQMCTSAHSSLVAAMKEKGTTNSLPTWMGDHDMTQEEEEEVKSDPGGIQKCYRIARDTSTDFGKFITPWFQNEYFTMDYFYGLLLDLSKCVHMSKEVWCTSHLMCMTWHAPWKVPMSFAMAIFGVTSTDSKTDTQAASAFSQGAVIMVHDVECMVCVTGMLRFGDLLSNKGKYEAAKEKCAKEGGSRRLHENGVCPILSIRVP